MSLPYLCPILAQKIRLSKDNSTIINSCFSQRVCIYGPLLEVKISAISCKLKPTYVFVFVLSAIFDASILEPKISTRYHVYDCEYGSFAVCHMSLVVRKPAFCICENKDADQLRSNCAADQRLCFRYTDSTIPLLPKCEISSL